MKRKFSFIASRFLTWAAKCLSRSSVAVYRHYFTKFVEFHGDLRIDRLRPTHLSEWAETWHQAQAIKRLFNWALHDALLVKKNPFARVKHPPKGQRLRTMTRREGSSLLRAAGRDLRLLLIAHRETFARPAELRAAEWVDLKSTNAELDIREALLQGFAVIVLHEFKCKKKRRLPNSARIILLSPRAGRLIVRIMDRTSTLCGPIFQTDRQRAWTPNAVRCRFRRIRVRLGWRRDRNGENIVPYTFRHTGATLASSLGIRDRVLADLLGHVETSTTARYQHLSIEHLRSALAKLWFRRPTRAG